MNRLSIDLYFQLTIAVRANDDSDVGVMLNPPRRPWRSSKYNSGILDD
jgi:hypothetical protein